MKNRKICVSIGENSVAKALEAANAVKGADVIEIRLDYIDKPDVSAFAALEGVELVFTCRPEWEGGLYNGLEKKRIALFKKVIDCKAAYLDIELAAEDSTKEEILKYRETKGADTKLILSNHNFEATAPLEDLFAIVDVMVDHGADIGKLITTAQESRDVVRIMTVLEYARNIKFPLIAFCMGEVGAVSRVASCDMGGYMTYCSADGLAATAPGQITVSNMNAIFSLYP